MNHLCEVRFMVLAGKDRLLIVIPAKAGTQIHFLSRCSTLPPASAGVTVLLYGG